MDDGLIFPYRRRTAHTEPGGTKHLAVHHVPSGIGGRLAAT